MTYNKFIYLYPPRPENKISNDVIDIFDDNTFLAQPKMNGSCCLIFLNNKECHIMNRHASQLHGVQISDEVRNLNKSNDWIVLVCEYLNKNKFDSNKQSFNHKLIIFDILVYNNDYLVGKTFKERQSILDSLFVTTYYDTYLSKISDNIFRVNNFYKDFSKLWLDITKIDMYEGLVFKRLKSPLEIGQSLLNNHKSQFKCRKPTKNYKF